MEIITLITDLKNNVFNEFLMRSCDFYKLNVVVLECENVYFSNRLKDAGLEEYLREVDDNEIIFFTDATDAFFLTNEQEILNKFYSFDCPLVFSTEVNCWPDPSIKDNYPPEYPSTRFLNSGGFIGKAGFIKEIYKTYPIFSTAIGSFNWSNQYYWHHIYLMESKFIKLDWNCDIFYNSTTIIENMDEFKRSISSSIDQEIVYDLDKKRLDTEIIFDNNRIKVINTNSTPCHIHLPGPISKMLLNRGYFSSIIWQ